MRSARAAKRLQDRRNTSRLARSLQQSLKILCRTATPNLPRSVCTTYDYIRPRAYNPGWRDRTDFAPPNGTSVYWVIDVGVRLVHSFLIDCRHNKNLSLQRGNRSDPWVFVIEIDYCSNTRLLSSQWCLQSQLNQLVRKHTNSGKKIVQETPKTARRAKKLV